jgi:hypothetical protein
VTTISDLRASLRPKYLAPPVGGDLTIVGSNMAPSAHPMALMTTLPQGNVAFERLFCDQNSDGSPVDYYYPGTFGQLVPAGRGYRG